MKTENHSIDYVLTTNATSFFIPPFQRAYAWGKPEIERYFSDVIRIIKSELNPKEYDKLEHFFWYDSYQIGVARTCQQISCCGRSTTAYNNFAVFNRFA
jgi:hypothetical protein